MVISVEVTSVLFDRTKNACDIFLNFSITIFRLPMMSLLFLMAAISKSVCMTDPPPRDSKSSTCELRKIIDHFYETPGPNKVVFESMSGVCVRRRTPCRRDFCTYVFIIPNLAYLWLARGMYARNGILVKWSSIGTLAQKPSVWKRFQRSNRCAVKSYGREKTAKKIPGEEKVSGRSFCGRLQKTGERPEGIQNMFSAKTARKSP